LSITIGCHIYYYTGYINRCTLRHDCSANKTDQWFFN